MREYYTLALGLLGIMIISTIVVVAFNSIVGLSTDVGDDDVSTSIAVIAFGIALVLRFVYFKDKT